MVVTFLRIIVKGDDESEIKKIQSYLDSNINSSDIKLGVDISSLRLIAESPLPFEGYNLTLDIFIKQGASKNYVTFFEDYLKTASKTLLKSVIIVKNDNCTHDEITPQPDIVTEVYSWSN